LDKLPVVKSLLITSFYIYLSIYNNVTYIKILLINYTLQFFLILRSILGIPESNVLDATSIASVG